MFAALPLVRGKSMGRCREYLARMRDCDGGEHEVVVSLASLHGDPAALMRLALPIGA